MPTTKITNNDQKSEERIWQIRKNLLDTYHNMRTSLRQLFERVVNPKYHSGGMINTGMARWGLGNNEPPAILECLKILCGTPSLQELDHAILRLHDAIDRNQPVEVMLWSTKEVQMFLMAHPDGDRELRYVNLISYAMIKISNCDLHLDVPWGTFGPL